MPFWTRWSPQGTPQPCSASRDADAEAAACEGGREEAVKPASPP